MKARRLHEWDVSPADARRIQERLAGELVLEGELGRPRTIAGADVAFDKPGKTAFAAVVVYDFPSLERIGTATARAPLTFPYVPGLLSFREGPVLLAALERLATSPDIILFDGQGIAHPRRFGLAAHMGLLLDVPTVGCAKSRLVGQFDEPAGAAGSRSTLRDRGDVIGAVLRTRDGVRPVFVSPGHRIGVEGSIEAVQACLDGLRIPKPTREADALVGRLKRGELR
jgi:deoxyribonuclease V